MSDATRAVYGRWARTYDYLARLPGIRGWRSRAVDALALDAGDTVVEMGCGTGANLPHLRERVGTTGRVVGFDLTREMLQRARGRWDADLVQADATRPPLAEPVDGLLATFVVAMFDEPATVVEEWCDLVRPGGRVALLHFTQSERWWTAPLSLAYRGFVWLASTNKREARDAAGNHDARVQEAHETLAARTTDYRERSLAGGYLRLASGRVE